MSGFRGDVAEVSAPEPGRASDSAAARDPDTFEYMPRTAERDYAVMRMLRSPEDHKRQGRTQSYQAIGRAAGRAPQRKQETDDQLALFDGLILEATQADDARLKDETAKEEGIE